MSKFEELQNSYHKQKVLIDQIIKKEFQKFKLSEVLGYLKSCTTILEFPFALLLNNKTLLKYLGSLTANDKILSEELKTIAKIALEKLLFLQSENHISEFLDYLNIKFADIKFSKNNRNDREELFFNIVEKLKEFEKIKLNFYPIMKYDEMNINSIGDLENVDTDPSYLKKIESQIYELKEDNFQDKLSDSHQYIYDFFGEKVNDLEKAFNEIQEINEYVKYNEINNNSNYNNMNINSSDKDKDDINIKKISSNNSKKDRKENSDLKNKKLVNIRDRTFFIINEKLYQEEDLEIEFKNYKYPLNDSLRKVIIKCINGFLNQNGGRIFIGVNDSGIVTGIRLTSKDRDIFKNEIVNLTQTFSPACRTNKIKVAFIPIMNDEKSMEGIENLYVVKIMVAKGDDNTLYSIYKETFTSYIRLEGQNVILDCDEIRKYIIERSKLENNPKNNIFTDPEPMKIGEYKIQSKIKEKNSNNEFIRDIEKSKYQENSEKEYESVMNHLKNIEKSKIDIDKRNQNINIYRKNDINNYQDYDIEMNNSNNINYINPNSKSISKSNYMRGNSKDRAILKHENSNINANSQINSNLIACKVINMPLNIKLDDLLVFIDRDKIVKMKELNDGNGKFKFGFLTFSEADQLDTLNYCIEDFNMRHKTNIQLINKV